MGQVIELQPLITLYQPAVEGDMLYHPTAERLAGYGYGAVYGPTEVTTKEAVIEWLTPKRKHTPVEWTVEYLIAYLRTTPEIAAVMILIHEANPALGSHTCEIHARAVIDRAEGGIADDVALATEISKAKNDIPF